MKKYIFIVVFFVCFLNIHATEDASENNALFIYSKILKNEHLKTKAISEKMNGDTIFYPFD